MAHITTYGGGDMLAHVFNAIAMLMNGGSDTLYRPLMLIGGLVGALWALGKAFWESSLNGLITQWLIPMVVLVGVCMAPTTTVTIIDVVSGGPLGVLYTVDHVPLGLARAAQTISTIGHALTCAVEQAFHTPDHLQYNATGMIFGAENLLEMRHYAITDETLAQSMRDFVHNCVTYDIMFNLYSMNDLKRSKNMWALIQNKTSQVRMFSLCTEGQKRCQLVSCREGAGALENILMPYINGLSAQHVLQYLPQFYQSLTGLSKTAQELIGQQLMIRTLVEATERKCEASGLGSNFAISRAYLQQRNSYEVVGGLAAKSLVVLRNIFEALIYAAFIFIMPFSLIPMGFKIFMKWLWLLVWIQLWPPFYAILNSGIMLTAKKSAVLIPGMDQGLTLLTSAGLNNLAMDMQAYAAYASLSVPFLSYALLQGGIASLTHIAASITGVSQGVGGTAAQERTTGNYSFGNVQLDTVSSFNQTMGQYNLAPSYAAGHFKEDYGSQTLMHTQDGMIAQERMSQLSVDLHSDKMLSQGLRTSAQTSADFAERKGETLIDTQMACSSQAYDYAEHVSSSEAYSANVSNANVHSIAQIGQDYHDKAAKWGEGHNLDAKTSSQVLSSVGLSTKDIFVGKILPRLGIDISTTSAASETEFYDDAKSFSESVSYAETHHALMTAATNTDINSHDEEGKRYAHTISDLYNASTQHQTQIDQHTQTADNLSRLADVAENQSVSVKKNLTPELVQWCANQKMDNGRMRGEDTALCMLTHSPKERDAAIDQFSKEYAQRNIITRHDLSTEQGFKDAQAELLSQSTPIPHAIKKPTLAPLFKTNIHEHKKELEANYEHTKDTVVADHNTKRTNIQQDTAIMQATVEEARSRSTMMIAIKTTPAVKAISKWPVPPDEDARVLEETTAFPLETDTAKPTTMARQTTDNKVAP